MLDELVLRFDTDNYMDGEQSLWQHKSDVDALTPVYAKLNRRFPPLYEQLLLNYRWTCGDTDAVCFWANPLKVVHNLFSSFESLVLSVIGDDK